MEQDLGKLDVWADWAQYALRTQQAHGFEVQLWTDGINLLIGCVTRLRGAQWPERDAGAAITAFMLHAVNTQLAALELAVTGQVPQALLLARVILEDLIAIFYVADSPQEAHRFLAQQEKRAPTTNEMLQALHKLPKDPMRVRLQGWLNRLHRLSHVDPVSVLLTFGEASADGQQWMHLGPHYSGDRFRECVGEFVVLIPPLAEAIQDVGSAWGEPAERPDAPELYQSRIMPYLIEVGLAVADDGSP